MIEIQNDQLTSNYASIKVVGCGGGGGNAVDRMITMGVKGVVAGCVVLGFIWAFHMVYFIWFVKTIPA